MTCPDLPEQIEEARNILVFRVPPEIRALLQARAEEDGTSKDEIIRTALRCHLDENSHD